VVEQQNIVSFSLYPVFRKGISPMPWQLKFGKAVLLWIMAHF